MRVFKYFSPTLRNLWAARWRIVWICFNYTTCWLKLPSGTVPRLFVVLCLLSCCIFLDLCRSTNALPISDPDKMDPDRWALCRTVLWVSIQSPEMQLATIFQGNRLSIIIIISAAASIASIPVIMSNALCGTSPRPGLGLAWLEGRHFQAVSHSLPSGESCFSKEPPTCFGTSTLTKVFRAEMIR